MTQIGAFYCKKVYLIYLESNEPQHIYQYACTYIK